MRAAKTSHFSNKTVRENERDGAIKDREKKKAKGHRNPDHNTQENKPCRKCHDSHNFYRKHQCLRTCKWPVC